MKSFPLEKAMILWTPRGTTERYKSTEGAVEIIQHPGRPGGRSSQFQRSYGVCNFPDWRDPEERLLRLFMAFNTLTVRDGMDPEITHRAFLAISEYRQAISPDQFGATEIGEDGAEQHVPEATLRI